MNHDLSFFEIFLRCLRSKCPVCGSGRLFAPFTRLGKFREFFLPLENCNSCGFRFAREPGYYFGVVTPILPILALMMGAFFAGIVYVSYHPELDTVLMAGVIGVFFGLLAFFRTAIAVYIALDHAVSPPPVKKMTEIRNETKSKD